jgi:hypothetical protein
MNSKELQKKIAKEFKLDKSLTKNNTATKLVSDYNFKEFDEWMEDLCKRNGTTEYVISNIKL